MGLKERMIARAEKRAAAMEEQERLLKESAVEAEYNEKGQILKKTNHSGGILGGISDGDEIFLRVHIKKRRRSGLR